MPVRYTRIPSERSIVMEKTKLIIRKTALAIILLLICGLAASPALAYGYHHHGYHHHGWYHHGYHYGGAYAYSAPGYYYAPARNYYYQPEPYYYNYSPAPEYYTPPPSGINLFFGIR
jgi:hypothetical protein